MCSPEMEKGRRDYPTKTWVRVQLAWGGVGGQSCPRALSEGKETRGGRARRATPQDLSAPPQSRCALSSVPWLLEPTGAATPSGMSPPACTTHRVPQDGGGSVLTLTQTGTAGGCQGRAIFSGGCTHIDCEVLGGAGDVAGGRQSLGDVLQCERGWPDGHGQPHHQVALGALECPAVSRINVRLGGEEPTGP